MERISSFTLVKKFLGRLSLRLFFGVALLGLFLFVSCRTLKVMRLGGLVSKDISTISLTVKLLIDSSEPATHRLGIYEHALEQSQQASLDLTKLNSGVSKSSDAGEESESSSESSSNSDSSESDSSKKAACQEIVVGDKTIYARPYIEKDCPDIVTWQVNSRPIAISLSFFDGGKVWDWAVQNRDAIDFLSSKVISGAFRDLMLTGSLRAEDLGLLNSPINLIPKEDLTKSLTANGFSGMLKEIKGAFVIELIREALNSHAVLDYDVFRTSKGFVFSFTREESNFASSSLPLVMSKIARRAYIVNGLEDVVYECRLGVDLVYITEQRGRVYIATGVESLLNTLDQLPSMGLVVHDNEDTLQVTFRGSAFMPGIMPVLLPKNATALNGDMASNSSAATLDYPNLDMFFHLDADKASLGEILVGASTLNAALSNKLFVGSLAAIPQDISAAVSASLYLPTEWTARDWNAHLQGLAQAEQTQLQQGQLLPVEYSIPDVAGVSVLLDISSKDSDPVTSIGAIVGTPNNLGQHDQFKSYLSHPERSASCAGGMVFLAATSESLLSKMKDSCENKVPSVLNFNYSGNIAKVDESQVLVFLNPGLAMTTLYDRASNRARGNMSYENQSSVTAPWKVAYNKALDLSNESAHRTFTALSIWGYAGRIEAAQAYANPLVLSGFTIPRTKQLK